MTTLRIPTPLRTYTGGQSDVPVAGSTAGEALAELVTQFPALRPHLFQDNGELRMFVNLFKGEENIKDLQGLQTPLGAGDRLMLIPSIAGG